MKLEQKYLVLKRADIDAALSDREKKELRRLVSRVAVYRMEQGKPDNSYVVVNLDEPYASQVLALMERQT